MQICRTNERTSSLLCLCRQLKHSFSSDRATQKLGSLAEEEKEKEKENSLERRECYLLFTGIARTFDKDRGAVSFRWKWLGRLAWQACSIWEERGGGSIFERSVRFLEKDEKGNVNSSTRVPLHPVRVKSASLFIRGKREISLDCKFHAVHSRRFAH